MLLNAPRIANDFRNTAADLRLASCQIHVRNTHHIALRSVISEQCGQPAQHVCADQHQYPTQNLPILIRGQHFQARHILLAKFVFWTLCLVADLVGVTKNSTAKRCESDANESEQAIQPDLVI
uniref:Uncharacterized protein n=1 Tax=Globodera pallida TaxID=36090 RepID=A0A183CPI9_GLOPA